jgi:predicted amidohydrolase
MKRKVRIAVTASRLVDHGLRGYFFSPNYSRALDSRLTRENMQHLLKLYDEAGRQGVRLVTSYENVTNVQSLPEFMDRVETVPGPVTERFARVARRRGMYAQLNLYEKDAGKIYNTSVLIDPDGRLAGKYRKVHLPPQERWHVSPGDGFPVCRTEIGNIGFSICYDIMFPETARAAALNGADVIIHSGNTSYTCRECYTRVRAAENMLWFLSCNILSMKMSEIVDPHGTVVAHSWGDTELITAEIDPRMERDMPGDNAWAGCRSLRGRMMQERVPSACGVISAAHPPILDRYREDRIPSLPQEYERAYAKGRKAAEAEYAGALVSSGSSHPRRAKRRV